MRRLKRILFRLVYPGTVLIILLTMIAAVLLIYIFKSNKQAYVLA